MSQTFTVDEQSARAAYDDEYLKGIIARYNDLLKDLDDGCITDAELVLCSRDKINRDKALQVKLYSIEKSYVDQIYQSYQSYGFDYTCEPQLITNRHSWGDTQDDHGDELLAGFKRNEAQDILERRKDAFQNPEDKMVFIRLYFKNRLAFNFTKTVSNTQQANSNTQANSPDDIVKILQVSIADGSLPYELYQTSNRQELLRYIMVLTRDKGSPASGSKFRSEVESKFYAKSNLDESYEIISKDNVPKLAEARNLPLTGKVFAKRNSLLYHSSSGEMKGTWYNMLRQYKLKGLKIDFIIYIGKPSDLPAQRLDEIKRLLISYSYFNNLKPEVDINNIVRCLGFHWQSKKGQPYEGGKEEVQIAKESDDNIEVLRNPYDWFYVKTEKQMKDFLKKNLTDKERNNGTHDDLLVEEQYRDIMNIYENSRMSS